jgi:hypothetical protein
MMMDSSFIYTELQPWLPLQEAVGGIPYDKALPALGFSENPTPPTDHLDCLHFTFQNLFTDIAECDGGNCHSRLCIGGHYPHLHYQDLNDLYESFFLVEPLISLLITIAPTLFKYVDHVSSTFWQEFHVHFVVVSYLQPGSFVLLKNINCLLGQSLIFELQR